MEQSHSLWYGHVMLQRPEACQIDPEGKKVVVAILKHDQSATLKTSQLDFLWINCKAKADIGQLHRVYSDKHPEAGPVQLCHLGHVCQGDTKLMQLEGQQENGLVVLEASTEADLARRMAFKTAAPPESPRMPLQPVSANIPRNGQQDDVKIGAATTPTPTKPLSFEGSNRSAASTPGSTRMNAQDTKSVSPRSTAPVLATIPRTILHGSYSAYSHHTPSPIAAQKPYLLFSTLPHQALLPGGPPAPPASASASQALATKNTDGPLDYAAQSQAPATQTAGALPVIAATNQTLASKTPPVSAAFPNQLPEALEKVPESELPSRRLLNRLVNKPFQAFMDHHYLQFPSSRSMSTADLLDYTWNKWQALENRDEKQYFTKPVQARLTSAMVATGSEEHQLSLEDIKPEVAPEYRNSPKERDEIRPLLNFQEDFGIVEQQEYDISQTASKIDFSIQDLIANSTLDELETFVKNGVRWLDDIEKILRSYDEESTDSKAYIARLNRVKTHAARTKTVIGVVGNTGAGKSSVINAMLDEEQLLPTNTMRACTAVVTELSYNWEECANYRAEVEFIDEVSWHEELKILFSDLIDDNGHMVRDANTADSDAGVAYAKIRGVYPRKTRDDIANSSIPNLLKEVSHILGKTHKVSHDDSLVFYKSLQRYIDSQEKIAATKSADPKNKPPREQELWPLIKVVRIYCKSPALATGAIIVDLPGVHDANAARAAVADGYMKQCSGLWIVAPIIRAVDDKAAKNLLGQTFKRQLKMDGGLDQVTFICSKTDDISIVEATRSLGLDDVNGPLWTKSDACKAHQAELEQKRLDAIEQRELKGAMTSSIDDQSEIWQQLMDDIQEDQTVYAPREKKKKKEKQKKRKAIVRSTRKTKRQKRNDDDDFIDDDSDDELSNDLSQEHEDDDDEEEEEEDDDEEVSIRRPLTEEEVRNKIKEFAEQRKALRKERLELNKRAEALKMQIQRSKDDHKAIQSVIAGNCIQGRNNYSKEAIQQDFAAGIRELDQEFAQEEDEENFNPDVDARDYDETAKSLPVFCVSSRGYQQLKGRLKKDAKVSGFEDIEKTEIPALQEHCKQLTNVGRTNACKTFLRELNTLSNSLSIWASNDGTNKHLTPEQRQKEEKALKRSLCKLESGLDKIAESTSEDLQTETKTHLFDKFLAASAAGEASAAQTAERWGSRPNAENRSAGGFAWSTYKAVCRRNGQYTNASGPIDYNADLVEPLMILIVPGWERNFTRRIPAVLANLGKNIQILVTTFHNDVLLRSQMCGMELPTLPLLEHQLKSYGDHFTNIAAKIKHTIELKQREVNRTFGPFIQNEMIPAYVGCVNEYGPGSFMRMKAIMLSHVSSAKDSMFRGSCRAVRKALEDLLCEAEGTLKDEIEEVFLAIDRDYRNAFSGSDLKPGQQPPKWHREMRKAISQHISELEDYLNHEEPTTEEVKEQIIEAHNEMIDHVAVKEEEHEEAQEILDPAAAQLMQEDTYVKTEQAMADSRTVPEDAVG